MFTGSAKKNSVESFKCYCVGPYNCQYLMGVAFHWHGESSTKPKICNLQYPLLLVNQQVLRLQITKN